jgi:hypothetical protein
VCVVTEIELEDLDDELGRKGGPGRAKRKRDAGRRKGDD